MSANPDARYDYDAFISFRHDDARYIARRLRDDLKRWRPPPDLESGAGDALKIYVDTYQRRPTNDFWSHNIVPALTASRFLIVIITPSVYESLADGSDNWVIREIKTFLEMPQGANIIPVLTDATKDYPLPDVLTDAHPRIQHFNIHSRDRFLPVVPFFEKPADLEVALIAGALFGVPQQYNAELLAETARRQNQHTTKVVSSLSVIVLVVGLAAVLAIWQGIRATKTAFETDFRTALSRSQLAPDEASLYATRALQIASGSRLFSFWMRSEQARARAVLGILALPEQISSRSTGTDQAMCKTWPGVSLLSARKKDWLCYASFFAPSTQQRNPDVAHHLFQIET